MKFQNIRAYVLIGMVLVLLALNLYAQSAIADVGRELDALKKAVDENRLIDDGLITQLENIDTDGIAAAMQSETGDFCEFCENQKDTEDSGVEPD